MVKTFLTEKIINIFMIFNTEKKEFYVIIERDENRYFVGEVP